MIEEDIAIVPAVLAENAETFVKTMSRLKDVASLVQIDVCDGVFVRNTTFPYGGAGDTVLWERITHEDTGLPFWDVLDFEVDLMVKEPWRVAEEWVRAGASRIVFHADTIQAAPHDVFSLYGSLVEIGVAIPAQANIETYRDVLTKAAYIQVMGIARIGFQGEPFDVRALDTIRALKRFFPEKLIQVDGGVTLASVPRLVAAGATRLVTGSFILSSLDPRGAVEQLKTVARKSTHS